MSADEYKDFASLDIDAPAFTYSSSEIMDSFPALDWTMTSNPDFTNWPTEFGTRDTRRSPKKTSLGMPIIMGLISKLV